MVSGRTFRLAMAAIGALAALAAGPAARADIWKFVDENGVVHLSDRKMGPGSVLIVQGKRKTARASSASFHQNRRRYSPLIDKIAYQFRLDRALVHAVVTAESAYDADAVSHKGAVGLMQLMPGTAQRYGVRDRYNPLQNVYGGVRYLRDLIYRFDNVVLALAAYNAGENAVERYGNRVPPFPETRRYVARVLTYYKKYR